MIIRCSPGFLLPVILCAFSTPSTATESVDVSVDRCGVYALQLCLEAIDKSRSALRVELDLPGENHSLGQLKQAASSEGVDVVALRWEDLPNKIRWGDAAAILPVARPNGRRHFVSLLANDANGELLIVDFPHPPGWV